MPHKDGGPRVAVLFREKAQNFLEIFLLPAGNPAFGFVTGGAARNAVWIVAAGADAVVRADVDGDGHTDSETGIRELRDLGKAVSIP